MSVVRIASRYAKSLFDIAVEKGKLEEVYSDVKLFSQVSRNSEFLSVLKSPIIKPDRKGKIFDAIFGGKINQITEAFVKIMIAKGREPYLAEIASAFADQYRVARNITRLKITSAETLDQTTIDKIVAKLRTEGAFNGEVEVTTALDEELLGGFTLEFNDKVYDSSIDYKLDQLTRAFSVNTYVREF